MPSLLSALTALSTNRTFCTDDLPVVLFSASLFFGFPRFRWHGNTEHADKVCWSYNPRDWKQFHIFINSVVNSPVFYRSVLLQQAQIHSVRDYKPAKKSKIGIVQFVTSFEVPCFVHGSVLKYWLTFFGPRTDPLSLRSLILLLRDFFSEKKPNAQYTPPTPTIQNCFVALRRRCVHEFATTADGFGDANAQRSRRPWPSSRLPTGVFSPTTRQNCRQLVANSCTHRRRDETRQFCLVGGVYWA